MEYVYRLIDPRDRATFYVGLTQDIYTRFIAHIQCNSNNYAKNARIHEMRAENVMVILETLQSVKTHEEGLIREVYWIRHFKVLGEPITNLSGTTLPQEIRKVTQFAPVTSSVPVTSLDLQGVLNVYRPGMTCRDLGRVLGVSHGTAGKYIQRLKDKGLITATG